VLEVFQDAGVCPKAADDLHAASARAVACHSDRSRPGVSDEMLKSAGKPVRTIACAGNSDKTGRRMTQHQVRTRSDVMRRLARIG
jgi:hypothetical protein